MRLPTTLATAMLGLLATLACNCSPPKLDDVLYDPVKAPAGGYRLSTAVIPAATAVVIPSSDGQTLQGYFIPAGGAHPDITLIYFHGRGNDVGTSWPRLEYLYPLGCNILAVDVRGYGLSTGSPDQPGIELDVKAIWGAAVGSAPVDGVTPVAPSHIVVYGRSLGAAFAVQLAASQSGGGALVPPGALVTESAFTSVAALVHDGVYVDLPPGFVARSTWDSLTKIRGVDADYLALHGDADSYVMPAYSQQLRDAHLAAVPSHASKLVLVPGADHDDVPERYPLASYQARLGCVLSTIAAKDAMVPPPDCPVSLGQ